MRRIYYQPSNCYRLSNFLLTLYTLCLFVSVSPKLGKFYIIDNTCQNKTNIFFSTLLFCFSALERLKKEKSIKSWYSVCYIFSYDRKSTYPVFQHNTSRLNISVTVSKNLTEFKKWKINCKVWTLAFSWSRYMEDQERWYCFHNHKKDVISQWVHIS